MAGRLASVKTVIKAVVSTAAPRRFLFFNFWNCGNLEVLGGKAGERKKKKKKHTLFSIKSQGGAKAKHKKLREQKKHLQRSDVFVFLTCFLGYGSVFVSCVLLWPPTPPRPPHLCVFCWKPRPPPPPPCVISSHLRSSARERPPWERHPHRLQNHPRRQCASLDEVEYQASS